MRMIGIGLLGFLLAAVAFILSSLNILEQGQRYIREIASGPQLVFEHRFQGDVQAQHTAVVLRSNPDAPVLLSGFPAYQSVAFSYPVDARPLSGYLQIDATAQVLDGVEGVLRISIHNTRRGEMLLRPGEAGRSLQIPLSPADFAGGQLVVSFSLQGTGPQHQCSQDDGIEAVVEIETTSAVYVTLDRPLATMRDQVRVGGDVVRVGWPKWLNPAEQVRRLILGAQIKQRNVHTVFDPSTSNQAFTTHQLREVLERLPQQRTDIATFPRPLAQSGTNAGVRRFHRRAVWRARYDLRDSPDQDVPAQLDLHMRFGRLIGADAWALTVTLNNRLVFQGTVPGDQTEFSAAIDLPFEMQASGNQIEVVAATTSPKAGICDHGPELVAEMLPDTRLVAGAAQFASPIADLRAALDGVRQIYITAASPLTALDADRASDWISTVVSPAPVLKPAITTAHIIVLTPASLPLTLPSGGWLVWQDGATKTLSTRRLPRGHTLSSTDFALLIVPTGLKPPKVGS